VSIPQIEDRFRDLFAKVGSDGMSFESGVKHITRKEILEQCGKCFESFLFSRHSIRYFTSAAPRREVIEKALLLAQQTPSACNRQGWRTHVFFGDSSHRLVRWQEGASGFEDEVHCSVLVTADLNAFFSHEVHQAYIDGGMYAMTLINALHSLGLGSIPLSCGFYCDKLSMLKESFIITENYVPIMIIGVGNLEESFRVAVSARKAVSETNTYHLKC
jgi:nitroreductase